MFVKQTCQLLVQCSGTDMQDVDTQDIDTQDVDTQDVNTQDVNTQDSNECEDIHLFSPRTVVADKKGKFS